MLLLKLDVKPYSVNRYFYGNRSIKRREAVEWETTIIEQLRSKEIQKSIEDFRQRFNPEHHSLSIDLCFAYPEATMITKKGTLSSRAFDLSNVEKPIIDVTFLEKYCTSTIKNLMVDDKFLTKMRSEKIASDEHAIFIRVQLEDLENCRRKEPSWFSDMTKPCTPPTDPDPSDP